MKPTARGASPSSSVGPLDLPRGRLVCLHSQLLRATGLSLPLASAELVSPPLSKSAVLEHCVLLCKDYVHHKLRRQGLYSRRLLSSGLLALLAAPPAIGGVEGSTGLLTTRPTDVSTELQRLGAQLERWYPQLYRDRVARRLNLTLTSEQVLHDTFLSLATTLFQGGAGGTGGAGGAGGAGTQVVGVTWGRVVALYAIVGALATECVYQGHGSYVTSLIHMFTEYLQLSGDHMVTWILQQGGWRELIWAFPVKRDMAVYWFIGGTILFLITTTLTLLLASSYI